MSRPIVFVDTETTALGRRARPWEIAVIRREPESTLSSIAHGLISAANVRAAEGLTPPPPVVARPPAVGWSDRESVLHVEYDFATLPTGTDPKALHIGRWLTRGAPGSTYLDELPGEVNALAASEAEVAHAIADLFEDEPILVGVGVHFDAAVLSAMFLRHGLPEEPWNYGLVDLKAESHGYLRALNRNQHVGNLSTLERAALQLPLSSHLLSEAVGVELPDDDERHTALGDARWARRWFDELTGGES